MAVRRLIPRIRAIVLLLSPARASRMSSWISMVAILPYAIGRPPSPGG